MRPGQSKVLYSLYGVVEHSGRLTGGHYTAYVKVRSKCPKFKDFIQNSDISGIKLDKLLTALYAYKQEILESPDATADGEDGHMLPPSGKWYYISDSRVTEVRNEANVLRCQAYLLFYERFY